MEQNSSNTIGLEAEDSWLIEGIWINPIWQPFVQTLIILLLECIVIKLILYFNEDKFITSERIFNNMSRKFNKIMGKIISNSAKQIGVEKNVCNIIFQYYCDLSISNSNSDNVLIDINSDSSLIVDNHNANRNNPINTRNNPINRHPINRQDIDWGEKVCNYLIKSCTYIKKVDNDDDKEQLKFILETRIKYVGVLRCFIFILTFCALFYEFAQDVNYNGYAFTSAMGRYLMRVSNSGFNYNLYYLWVVIFSVYGEELDGMTTYVEHCECCNNIKHVFVTSILLLLFTGWTMYFVFHMFVNSMSSAIYLPVFIPILLAFYVCGNILYYVFNFISTNFFGVLNSRVRSDLAMKIVMNIIIWLMLTNSWCLSYFMLGHMGDDWPGAIKLDWNLRVDSAVWINTEIRSATWTDWVFFIGAIC